MSTTNVVIYLILSANHGNCKIRSILDEEGKMISFSRSRGCDGYFFPPEGEVHEKECKYRPVSCQHQANGCKAVFSHKVGINVVIFKKAMSSSMA